MKLSLINPKRKLRASAAAARRSAQPRDFEEDEPTMKLSSAFIVVLLLHLVAVGGIYAFNSVKAHRPAVVEAPEKPVVSAVQNTAPIAPAKPVAVAGASIAQPAAVNAEPVKPVEVAQKTAAPVVAKDMIRDSGTLYTIAKGDNPERIAKKLHVNYGELVKLNKIDDPTKLQIGQKLRVPAKLRASN